MKKLLIVLIVCAFTLAPIAHNYFNAKVAWGLIGVGWIGLGALYVQDEQNESEES